MHPLKVQAVYQDTGVPAYKGNLCTRQISQNPYPIRILLS